MTRQKLVGWILVAVSCVFLAYFIKVERVNQNAFLCPVQLFNQITRLIADEG